jgi:RNA polymerase sigma-70 factor (ECF subfamily)
MLLAGNNDRQATPVTPRSLPHPGAATLCRSSDLPGNEMTAPGFTARDLAEAARGDEAAFTTVFRELQPVVLRYLRTLAPDAAEDLAGETWVHVVRGLRTFEGAPDAFRAWTLTIARHRWVDHVRRSARQPPQLDESAALDLPASLQVEDQVEEMFSTERALEIIGRLPPDQAEVIVLRVVADLDVRATAAIVGKRPGTVRVLAHRGLRRLEQLVGNDPTRGVTHGSGSSVTGES